jgi:uncharacterized protein (TIGR03118 family)
MRSVLRALVLGTSALLTAGATSAAADVSTYVQTNLVSDLPGVALVQDPQLVNPWGLSAGPTSPIWTSNNGTASSSLYSGFTASAPPAIVHLGATGSVAIPAGGLPTGTVFNSSTNPADFTVSDGTTSAPAAFLFASLTGAITGWNPAVGTGGSPPPSNTAEVAVQVPGAVYTGLALGTTNQGARLYAANFAQGRVDVWDGNWTPAAAPGAFTDRALPAGYSPFNVQVIGDRLYVAYGKADPTSGETENRAGEGAVDVYTLQGRLLQRLVTHDGLDAPWGLVRAPGGFGAFSNALLVGNFGNGRIHAYDIRTGTMLGVVRDAGGAPIVNSGLWGLRFGNGTIGTKHTLIFAAGIDDETHGLLGAIQPAG